MGVVYKEREETNSPRFPNLSGDGPGDNRDQKQILHPSVYYRKSLSRPKLGAIPLKQGTNKLATVM